MRKTILFSLFVLFSLNVFGHAGEVHKYMGTVITVNENGSFLLKTTEGKEIAVEVSKATVYRYSDGESAVRSDVVSGKRAVVTISKDGKTASEVKLAKQK